MCDPDDDDIINVNVIGLCVNTVTTMIETIDYRQIKFRGDPKYHNIVTQWKYHIRKKFRPVKQKSVSTRIAFINDLNDHTGKCVNKYDTYFIMDNVTDGE